MKILLISLIFTINILALDFNMIPENFHATNIKVSLGLASSIARSKSKIISFTNNKKDLPVTIIAYYKQYFNKEWEICEDTVTDNNKFILDYSGAKYEVKKFNLGFNKDRLLSSMIKVGKNVETNKTHTFIVQYYYSNQQQFYREYNGLCN